MYENEVPLVAVAVFALLMEGFDCVAGMATLRLSILVPVPTGFVALMATRKVPVTPGIPVMMPVVVSIVRPVGSPVAAKVLGELVADIV